MKDSVNTPSTEPYVPPRWCRGGSAVKSQQRQWSLFSDEVTLAAEISDGAARAGSKIMRSKRVRAGSELLALEEEAIVDFLVAAEEGAVVAELTGNTLSRAAILEAAYLLKRARRRLGLDEFLFTLENAPGSEDETCMADLDDSVMNAVFVDVGLYVPGGIGEDADRKQLCDVEASVVAPPEVSVGVVDARGQTETFHARSGAGLCWPSQEDCGRVSKPSLNDTAADGLNLRRGEQAASGKGSASSMPWKQTLLEAASGKGTASSIPWKQTLLEERFYASHPSADGPHLHRDEQATSGKGTASSIPWKQTVLEELGQVGDMPRVLGRVPKKVQLVYSNLTESEDIVCRGAFSRRDLDSGGLAGKEAGIPETSRPNVVNSSAEMNLQIIPSQCSVSCSSMCAKDPVMQSPREHKEKDSSVNGVKRRRIRSLRPYSTTSNHLDIRLSTVQLTSGENRRPTMRSGGPANMGCTEEVEGRPSSQHDKFCNAGCLGADHLASAHLPTSQAPGQAPPCMGVKVKTYQRRKKWHGAHRLYERLDKHFSAQEGRAAGVCPEHPSIRVLNNTVSPRYLFRGLQFLLTGYKPQEKCEVEQIIEEHGGSVLQEIPPSSFLQVKMLRLTSRAQNRPPIVIAPQQVRTSKFLYGCAIGFPPLKPDWISLSIARGQCLPYSEYEHSFNLPSKSNLINRSGKPMLEGLRAVLYGQLSFRLGLSALLEHGGGRVLKTLRSLKQASRSAPILLDVLIVEDLKDLPQRHRTMALKFNMPIVPAEWLVQSLLSHRLLPMPESKGDPLQLPDVACSTDFLVVRKKRSKRIVAENTVTDAVSAQPLQRPHCVGIGSCFSSPAPVPQFMQESAGFFSDAYTCRESLKNSLFYEACRLDAVEYYVGDIVEVCLSKDQEAISQVVRIESLWSKVVTRAADGGSSSSVCNPIHMRCRKFFWPSETTYHCDQKRAIFASNDFRDLPISCILRKVNVMLEAANQTYSSNHWMQRPDHSCGTLPCSGQATLTYRCRFFYDHSSQALYEIGAPSTAEGGSRGSNCR